MLNSIRGWLSSWRLSAVVDKRPKRRQNGTYWSCPADEAMRICKLRPIQVFISLGEDTTVCREETTDLRTMQGGGTKCRNSDQN
mmetsp:Transcript_23702/g.23970  ORF Transcript_23702/g.23970 Transcript_23702/m.23970 type:complete len:84 (+) Transcript_23702:872-1123(+)